MRELDFSKITLRLVKYVDKEGDGKEEHIVSKLQGNTLEVLRRALVSSAKHSYNRKL